MSSHHIVREKQEPALLIMSLKDFSREHLGQLLEWSPTVILHSAIMPEVTELGIKIDAILTTSSEEHLLGFHHTRIIEYTTSPIEDALKFLVGEKYHAVNVVDDCFYLKDYLLFAEHIDLSVYTGKKKIFTVRSGFSKWQVKGQEIELLHEVKNLSTGGLIPIAGNRYRTEKDGFYNLKFSQPFAFISEDFYD